MNKTVTCLKAIAALLVLLFLDQLTKQLAATHLYQQKPIEILPGIFELRFLMNKGAAFGILQNHQYFFVALTSLIVCILIYIFFRIPAVSRYMPIKALLVLLTAGAIGNFVDRIRLGYVIDFLYFKLIDFPIFNVADCYVVVSVILLAILVLFYYKEEEMDELAEKLKPGKKQQY
ncbi:MAG: signal peptidase II [Lachnospiraceae bacterium]|nr:signal peptidase II [Lachnospiraceae bacterium]